MMTNISRLPRLLSIKDVAKVLQVSTKTIRRGIDDANLRVHRLGRQLRLSEEDLAAFVICFPLPCRDAIFLGVKKSPPAPAPGESEGSFSRIVTSTMSAIRPDALTVLDALVALVRLLARQAAVEASRGMQPNLSTGNTR